VPFSQELCSAGKSPSKVGHGGGKKDEKTYTKQAKTSVTTLPNPGGKRKATVNAQNEKSLTGSNPFNKHQLVWQKGETPLKEGINLKLKGGHRDRGNEKTVRQGV